MERTHRASSDLLPAKAGRRWREAPDEGQSEDSRQMTEDRRTNAPHSVLRPLFSVFWCEAPHPPFGHLLPAFAGRRSEEARVAKKMCPLHCAFAGRRSEEARVAKKMCPLHSAFAGRRLNSGVFIRAECAL